MPNRLAAESSPYLRQHADNPVDWYPWGPEALARARREDKPIFLSIGYSACHWCHVMERESFQDAEVAALLNAHFISLKVDREERPDLDAVYLQAVASLTGQAGWPLSVWLTPEGAPFYGGTYFPPTPRLGLPSFRQVVTGVARLWQERRADILRAAQELAVELERQAQQQAPSSSRQQILASSLGVLRASFDPENGGWGGAPKFPAPLVLDYLLAHVALGPGRGAPDLAHELGRMVDLTLEAMARGGLYDQLGGGFHRYSTDEAWLVPHFEKMLYDNAQLARSYLHAWQLTARPLYRRVAAETLDYLLAGLRHPQGAFFSAEDADSDGKEGAFYLWTMDELTRLLTPKELAWATQVFGLTGQGHFAGGNILHFLGRFPQDTDEDRELLEQVKAKLLAARQGRPRPLRDEKILAGWNGLAIAVLAEAGRALGSERHTEAAQAAAEFLLENLFREGHLVHSWTEGRLGGEGFLTDYAYLSEGLLALYQSTFEKRWLSAARELAEVMIARFHRQGGGFYDVAASHETPLFRPRVLEDTPTPSGNSSAAVLLLKLSALTGEERYSHLAEETLAAGPAHMADAPVLYGQWLTAVLLAETGLTTVAVIGEPQSPLTQALFAPLWETFRPAVVIAAGAPQSVSALPLLQGKPVQTAPTAWVCHRQTCSLPVASPEVLRTVLDQDSPSAPAA